MDGSNMPSSRGNNWTTWFLRFFSNPYCSDAKQSDSLGLMGSEGCFWCDVRGGGPARGAVRGAVLEVASGRHSRSKHQGCVVINIE